MSLELDESTAQVFQTKQLQAELWAGLKDPSFMFSLFDSVEDLHKFIGNLNLSPGNLQEIYALNKLNQNKIFEFKNKLFKENMLLEKF